MSAAPYLATVAAVLPASRYSVTEARDWDVKQGLR